MVVGGAGAEGDDMVHTWDGWVTVWVSEEKEEKSCVSFRLNQPLCRRVYRFFLKNVSAGKGIEHSGYFKSNIFLHTQPPQASRSCQQQQPRNQSHPAHWRRK